MRLDEFNNIIVLNTALIDSTFLKSRPEIALVYQSNNVTHNTFYRVKLSVTRGSTLCNPVPSVALSRLSRELVNRIDTQLYGWIYACNLPLTLMMDLTNSLFAAWLILCWPLMLFPQPWVRNREVACISSQYLAGLHPGDKALVYCKILRTRSFKRGLHDLSTGSPWFEGHWLRFEDASLGLVSAMKAEMIEWPPSYWVCIHIIAY